MTNYEKLRQMSIEDLFKALGHGSLCDFIQRHDLKHCEERDSCPGCIKEWLEKEAVDYGKFIDWSDDGWVETPTEKS